jgi:quercetin dioxygenase-like cupin family protein
MVLVLDSKVKTRIAGNPYRLNAGQTIIMPAIQPHASTAVAAFKMLLTMIQSG